MNEKNIEELEETAVSEHIEEPKNETYVDGEVVETTDVPGPEDHTEGNVTASNDVKEDAAEEIKQNLSEQAADAPLDENEGTGAHSSVRGAWSNGNWGL